MDDLNSVSQQAFIQEIQNWELTLHRETKKLRQLKKVTSNKLQINTIDITLINIQSQLIQYKKVKENKYGGNSSIIQLYTALSKRFMNIMQKIGESAQNDRYREMCNTTQNELKTQQNNCPNKTKHFLQQTFTHNLSKQPSKKKNKSMIQTKKQVNDLIREKTLIKQLNRNKRSIGESRNQRNKIYSNLNRLELEQEQDLYDIRYQLKQIKSMMTQMQKEIKLHNHEDLDKQISKLGHNNKKLTLEIKNIKEDNQFLVARMQNLKEQINHQKNMQAQMIRKIQLGREGKTQVNQLSKQKNQTGEISDWVKIRI